ncbi:MAG: DNA-directed RNA polymerase subunit beta', partial [Oscillospiraceae bacterium]|nr:DNA-directed RNA polymerase subunit beta' [Oscillospiraceae bacterium]
VREHDCGTVNGIWVGAVYQNGDVIDTFGNRIRGRYPVEDVVDPATGEVIHSKDVMMMPEDAQKFEDAGIEKIYIRTILACRARVGVCAKCYGMNLATSKEVDLGEAVGVIAAQSIGEPGTQLTMRTFHSGGVAGDDITQGLPRVEELFEARRPKKMATISEITGVVNIDDTRRTALRNITVTADDGEVKVYQVPYSVGLKVQHGKVVQKGTPITDGALYPQDVLRISGVEAVQDYLVQSVQAVYRQQGVEINDKHIEVIIRQMMRKVRVEEPGDTALLTGSTVDTFEFEDANAAVQARIDAGETELKLATCSAMLLGITKAALATDSFLSAASFQETTKVLTDAAIKGKVDHLVGLKENVLIGKLIPAGSGLMAYRDYQPGITPESRLTDDCVEAELN